MQTPVRMSFYGGHVCKTIHWDAHNYLNRYTNVPKRYERSVNKR
jgi:hypothetical protein